MNTQNHHEAILVVDNVRSVMNVGSMFRTSNALGIKKIYICGITPTPLDKYGRPRKDFAKVSLGAEETTNWEYIPTTLECIKKLNKEGYLTIAIEQNKNAVDYKTIDINERQKIAIVMGSETDGVSNDVLEEVSLIAEIPMLGSKESLNVVIAFGIATYRILGI